MDKVNLHEAARVIENARSKASVSSDYAEILAEISKAAALLAVAEAVNNLAERME